MARYYPKSQIKSNLYTKGKEYQYSDSQREYKGYYHITSQGQTYTGKHPGDLPNDSLDPIINIESQPFIDSQPPTISKPTSWTYIGQGYNKNFPSPPTLPTSTYPTPQPSDYKLGEFQRYFLTKINGIKYIEINQGLFNKYLNKSKNVSYQLYSPLSISWVLTGDRKKVYEINYKTVQRIERDLELRGFIQYFKGRFDQFYKEVDS